MEKGDYWKTVMTVDSVEMCLVHCCQGNVKFIIVQFLEICFHIDSVESAQPPKIWLLDLVALPTLPLPEVSDFFFLVRLI